jgi:hypothetical protein
VVQRFGEAPEPAVRERVATALVNKGVRLGQLNRSEESKAAYRELVLRFGDAAEPSIQELVSEARAELESSESPPPSTASPLARTAP